MSNLSQNTNVSHTSSNLFAPMYSYFWRYVGWICFIFLLILFINDFFQFNIKLLSLLLIYIATISIFTLCWKMRKYNYNENMIVSSIHSILNEKNIFKKIIFIIPHVLLALLSSTLSSYLYSSLMITAYTSSIIATFFIIVIGSIAFCLLPIHTTALLSFIETVNTTNFYGGNFDTIVSDMGIYDYTDCTFFLCFIFFLVLRYICQKLFNQERPVNRTLNLTIFQKISNAKEHWLPCLLFFFQYIFALLIDFMYQIPLFARIFLYDGYSSTEMVIYSIMYFSLIIMLTMYPYQKNKFIFTRYIFIIFATTLFIPPLKAQACIYQENMLLQHQSLYQQAKDDDNLVPGQQIILYEKAAHAGNPKAMYEVAKYYFSSTSLVKLNIKTIEKYIKYLYLASILGEKQARELLYDIVKEKIYPYGETIRRIDDFFAFGSPTERITQYMSYFARYYLCLEAVFDNGFFAKNIYSQEARKRQQYNIQRGKEVLRSLAHQNISNKPNITLAEIAFLEGKAPLALSILNELIKENDAEALFSLGMHYLHGKGVPQSRAKAMQYFKKAQEQHHDDASFMWAVTTFNTETSTTEEKQSACTTLMQLYNKYHPGARLNVTLRWLRNDPLFLHMTSEVFGVQDDNTTLPVTVETDGNKKQRGKEILLSIINLGEDAYFNSGGTAYMPEIMGKEIVIATYELARLLYLENNIPESIKLLKRPTQEGHNPSITLLSKIIAETTYL